MRIVFFVHSVLSCWNHGNAHFLRGVMRSLLAAGHDVRAYEPAEGWSHANLLADGGRAALDAAAATFPDLAARTRPHDRDIAAMSDGADAVIVHEWNDPSFVAAVARAKPPGAVALFHDTHHRAVSDPDAMAAYDLRDFDGVLAFGASLADVYRGRGIGARVWHEAADTALFRPPVAEGARAGAVWIGNWGDEERSLELRDYLLGPTHAEGIPLTIHGVRYPATALAALAEAGASFRGWLPNHAAPETFARHALTVHVPRRFYVTHLPGIPTIRVFEALACGIPLVSAPWNDCEGLFDVGGDFLMAGSPAEMRAHLRAVRDDAGLRQSLAARGLAAIRARHTCDHRAVELLAIIAGLRVPVAEAV